MKFWLILVFVNVIMWIPSYLINFSNQKNPFFFLDLDGYSLKDKVFSFYLRKASDPFRIHADFTIAILLFLVLGFTGKIASAAIGIIGTISLISMLYGAIITHLFKRMTALKSDLDFAKVGLVIARKWKYPIILFMLLLSVLFYVGCKYSAEYLLSFDVENILLISGLLVLIPVSFYKPKSMRYYVFRLTFFSGLLHLFYSYKRGLRYDFILGKTTDFFKSKNLYKDLELEEKPNIEILCIESYGSMAWKDNTIREYMTEMFSKFEKSISEKKLSVASGMSLPPLFAGGSWLSYSTLLFGLKIDDTAMYKLLFTNDNNFDVYQSLLRWTQKQGYTNFLTNPLKGGYDKDIDWTSVNKNLSPDYFFGWENMDYNGKEFKYLDVGSCPADQYVLHKSKELIMAKRGNSNVPYTNFYITMNSHYPYSSPVNIVEDWTNLSSNVDYPTTGNGKNDLKNKYKNAIKYQLKSLFDYILKQDNNDTIYVLFGDHQPPFITDDNMGLETPMHIISSNEKLLQPFLEEGFINGLTIKNIDGYRIKHEGFLSLFMNGLNSAYGKKPEKKFEYYSDGIALDKY